MVKHNSKGTFSVVQSIQSYPNLKRVALELAYDNGMINRCCSEELWLSSIEPIIGAEGVYHEDLVAWDAWLGTLTDEEIQTVACGETSDMEKIMANAPESVSSNDEASLNGLLNDIFEVEQTEQERLNIEQFVMNAGEEGDDSAD
jgi:hypothetical protein